MDALRRAIAIVENSTGRITDPGKSAAYEAALSGGALYARAAFALHKLKRDAEALAMAENGRGRSLARLAARNDLPLTALIGDEAASWQSANRECGALGRQIGDMSKFKGTPLAADLPKRINALRQAEVKRQPGRHSPRYWAAFQVIGDSNPVRLAPGRPHPDIATLPAIKPDGDLFTHHPRTWSATSVSSPESVFSARPHVGAQDAR